ncbi:NAD(P)/FAD-dependent oxidoreductase [Psychrobacter aestuarii]|uniref:NAD(P)/FAD-dependent oxidoreductase n=1 Tax=Psychrobacter aestuarii TaxID=556327 RepID=A0ABN0VM08_9GAMM|nr:FAD-dependent oxidoreductase [Psychrobacter aestuarii]
MPIARPKLNAIKKLGKTLKTRSKAQPNEQAAESVPQKSRLAIIGSGVSGLTCAHYLNGDYDVTIFEANDYIGGHVNTIDVALQTGKKGKVETSAIDTGFIVFNERTYPNFLRLLHELDVPFQATDMSFSVKNSARNFEYNGHTLNTLLSQRKNVLSPQFWQFISDIMKFNKHIRQLRADYDVARAAGQDTSALSTQTLGDYLVGQRYGALFTDNYLLPMVSAIWSTSLREVQGFPLIFFAQFFDNHGLLDVVNRPQWFTIKGGSKQYVNTLVTRFVTAGGTIRVNSPVQSVQRNSDSVRIEFKTLGKADEQTTRVQSEDFDEVIFACHADTALRLLADASDDEKEVLGHFYFTPNTAVLHTDTRVLPKKSLAWASWNYLTDAPTKQTDSQAPQSAQNKPVLTYHMNILQRLTKAHNYLVTLNEDIDAQHVIKCIDYSHPVYTNKMVAAQGQWGRISGQQHTHFCGAYWFNGFHEDGVRSALRVCQALGADIDIKDDVDAQHIPDAKQTTTPFRYRDLPVKADKKPRDLKRRQVIRAATNQDLIKQIEQIKSEAANSAPKSKTSKRAWLKQQRP